MSTYYSVVKYFEGASGESTFTITFPYLRRDHVFVYLSEEPLSDLDPVTGEPNPPVSTTLLVRGVDYSIQNDTSVVLTDPLPPQNSLTIRRFTELDQRLASYFDASYLTETELNEVTLQFLYLIQEIEDRRLIGEGGDIVAGAPSDDGGDVPTLEDIVASVLQTPLFDTLTTLIPFVDLNAESVIRNAIARHEDWSLQETREIFKDRAFEERDQALALRDSIIEDNFLDLRQIQGANFTELFNFIEEEGMARATQLTSLTAVVNGNFSAFETFTSVYVDDQEATGLRFENLQSDFNDNSAFVTSIWETFSSENEARASEITLLDARVTSEVNTVNASIFDLSEVVATNEDASALRISQLESSFTSANNETNALVLDLSSTFANETGATATRFSTIEAFAVNLNSGLIAAQADVTQLENVQVTQESAIASLVTEVGTKLTVDQLDGPVEQLIGSSSHIEGVRQSIQATDSGVLVEAQRIDSLLSRVDAYDADLNAVSTNVAISQDFASQAVTEAEATAMRLEMIGVAFGMDPNNWFPADWAAAVQDKYEVYADDNIAFASRFYSLQANAKPTIYSSLVPNPYSLPYRQDYADFVTRENISAQQPPGFPVGTIWVRDYTQNGKFYRRHYEWVKDLGFDVPVPAGIDPNETNGPDVFAVEYNFFEPNGTVSGSTSVGYWVDTGATALGALVGRFEDVDVSEDSASAMLRDIVQASVAGIDAAVEQRLRVDIEGSTGNARAEYSTRINVTRPDGVPVIAGFGLGVATDPGGVDKSDFIVMADRFTVVAPPVDGFGIPTESGSYSLSPRDPIVPFLIDTNNSTVYINGNLFISDTLYGYQGRLREVHLGKAVFGQMFSNANNATDRNPAYNDLVNPNGYRFELTSSTDGFWTGPSRDYLMWAGSETKNDNNAKFWLDSDGNAFFGGTVQAGNISGALSNVFSRGHNNNPWLPSNGTAWRNCNPDNDGWETFSISSSRLLAPVFLCNFSMVHGRAGEVLVEARYDKGGGAYTTEQVIAGASWTMDRTDGAQNVSVQGALPTNINTNVQVRLRFRDPYGFPHSNDGYSILALMLPDSATAGGGGTASAGGTTTEGNLPDSPFAFQ